MKDKKDSKVKSRLGMKQPASKQVTGTIVMMDRDTSSSQSKSLADTSTLKKSPGGIILHPQPHDSPNDPLNWPLWQRDMCLLVVGFQSFLGGGQSPILASAMKSLLEEFHRTLSTISYLVGGFMLALGFGSVLASPTAILYGKRMVYLVGIFLFFMGSIWAALAKDFGNLMGGRILTGIGASPTESLTSATISEIYFAHERAYRIGIYTMLLLGGKNIVPLLSGLVLEHLDRHWLFWILAIILGANLVLTFIFAPETFWDRKAKPSKRSLEETKAARSAESYVPPEERPNAFALVQSESASESFDESLASSLNCQQRSQVSANAPIGITQVGTNTAKSPNKKGRSFFRKQMIFTGRHSKDSWYKVALRPFFLYAYPAVLFGAIIYSFAVVWLIVLSEVVSNIFTGDGYRYSEQTVGLFYISPFVGGMLGSLLTGIISDRLIRVLTRKNNGIYEPEFRLPMLIFATLISTLGLMGFGWSSQQKDVWIAPVVFFGCIGFGSSMSSTTAITFTVDSYKMFAAEALVTFNLLKNVLGFIFSIFNTDALQTRGGKTTFIIYGAVQIFISLFAIPVYIYGKQLRSWTDKKEILKYLYSLEKHTENVESKNDKEGTNNA